MSLMAIIETSLYFLALINPPSKVFILSSMNPPLTKEQLTKVSFLSSAVAWAILFLLSSVGNYLLVRIFRVEIYSLQVAGGIILFIIGLKAVQRGSFYEKTVQGSYDDISVVPIGAPLIAGPGTITAAISFASTHGTLTTMTSITIAIIINFIVMVGSLRIGKTLVHLHMSGPLIRIAGLVVAAVAMQMVFSGVSQWLTPLMAK